jgi:predicted ester cyclase
MSTDQVKLGYLYAEIVSSHDVSRFDELVAVFAEDVFVSADGTRVVGRYRYEGTHTGNFLGYAATGNAFAMRSIDIWRVEDGRFVEHWDELNTLDIFIQVGAVPPPGQPS